MKHMEGKILASRMVWKSMKAMESILIHKTRIKWIREGDSKSKFFHNSMKNKFRRNLIKDLNTARGS